MCLMPFVLYGDFVFTDNSHLVYQGFETPDQLFTT